MSRDGMQDVELVELPGDESDHGAGDRDGSAPLRESAAVRGAVRAARWARRRWPVLAGAVLVVTLVVAGVRIQEWRTERAYMASLVGVPGILAPLDASTAELWRADIGLDQGDGYFVPWQAVDDVLVGAGQTADGMRVVALDVETGAVQWDLLAPALPGGDGPLEPVHVPGGETSRPVLVYLSASVWVDGEDGVSVQDPAPREVLVVDVERGEIVGRHSVGSQVIVDPIGEHLVVGETQPDGHVRVSLLDPVTWEDVWSHDGPVPPVVDLGAADAANRSDGPSVAAADGRIAVVSETGAVEVLSVTGELVAELPGAAKPPGVAETRAWAIEMGGHLVRYASSDSDGGTLLDLTNGRSFDIGYWYGHAVSDGRSGPRVLVSVDGTRLDLLDLDSGETVALPADEDSYVTGVSLVRGQVLVQVVPFTGGLRGSVLSAQDDDTGALRWTSAVRGDPSSVDVTAYGLTDGRHVLLLEEAEEDPVGAALGTAPEWRLTAFSVTDGHREWDVPVPDGVVRLVEIGGRLYGMGDSGEVVALG